MSQGLFTAVSGIKTSQAKIDVIADNIANMNTAGFKASKVNFENIFTRTLSSGTAPTGSTGGTNPMQVGLGVVIGEIGRSFTGGTVQTTGRTTDLNIQGNGFFTVASNDGSILLTRAGNFTTDSNGNIVTSQGLKVLGTSETSSITGSSTPLRVPQSLKLDKTQTNVVGTDKVVDICLNDGKITEGVFTLNINNGGTVKQITIDENTTVSDLITDINGNGLTATITNGVFNIQADNTVTSLTMGTSSDTSNFLAITELNAATGVAAGGGAYDYSSSTLSNNKVTVNYADSSNSSYPISSFSIGDNGAIEATYSNGDKITVTGEPTRELVYKSSTGTEIRSANITVIGNAILPEELQMQLANVVNPNGLLSQGGNLFAFAPNAGTPNFAVGNSGGMGSIDSGGLESSNVDLPSEFAELILAQRAVDANSRTFEAQNTIMRTIVNLGR